MKKILAFAAVSACLFAAACTTTPNTSGSLALPQTPAQIAAQVCPPVQAAMNGLNALVGLPEGAQKDLAMLTPIVADVCAVGASVNADNLQDLAKTALPAIVSVVKASTLAPEEQNAIIVDVTAAQLVLTAVTQAQANLATPITSGTASAPLSK